MNDKGEVVAFVAKNGKSWDARTAAIDASQRVPPDVPFIAVWIEKTPDGNRSVKWSKANTSFEDVYAFAQVFLEFAQGWVRNAMDQKKEP